MTSVSTRGCGQRLPISRRRLPGSGARIAAPRRLQTLSILKPGDIIRVPSGKSHGLGGDHRSGRSS